jgi:hypothetical protein
VEKGLLCAQVNEIHELKLTQKIRFFNILYHPIEEITYLHNSKAQKTSDQVQF